MATRTRDLFTTVTIEGALLPPDILQRIAGGDNGLDGLHPQDYHEYGRLNEATNFIWNRLQSFWQAFKSSREHLPEDDTGATITRERWLLPLFDMLGYGRLEYVGSIEHDEQRYNISHLWRNVPINLIGCNLDLDRRQKGTSSGSPHSQLQVLLNRDESNLWGFLSNGLRLRILRDNISLTRQAYIEFDLEAMMEGEVYSDFVLLYLLCHQSRVEADNVHEYWLEQWRKAAEEQGKRALDSLRDGVEKAINHLGKGFLSHAANTDLRDALRDGELNKQDYYRELLRLVYRMLFLFVAEDRDLLHHPDASDEERERYHYYSTNRLRDIAANLRGSRHHDLYEALRLVMRLLGGERDGAEGLGLPMLGSFLFSDEAVSHIIDAKISNHDLLEAVRAISTTEDVEIRRLRRVDFKNLGSEELGSVYESLLELHPDINVDARTFNLSTASGHERKTTGSYYTPTSLINALLDSALDPVLEDTITAPEGEKLTRAEMEAAILDLKVCDPACGSGHFLIAAANRMAKRLAAVRTGEEEPPPADMTRARRDVIAHCIYGVDINPMAVELCKVNLWLESIDPGKPLTFLEHRIQVGNSLLGTTPKLMREGIPDAAFQPIEGDDKSAASIIRKQNKEERRGQMTLWETLADDPAADVAELARQMSELDALPDDTLQGILARERLYQDILMLPERRRQKLLADAWCSAFVWVKKQQTTDDIPPLTQRIYQQLEQDSPFRQRTAIEAEVARLAERYQFFHWHVAFPDAFDVPPRGVSAENEQTGWNGGFSVVLGNPPWERIKIQEKEWFAGRNSKIANAPRASERRKLIEQLAHTDPELLEAFNDDKRKAEGESHFVRVSERYPLCGRGDVNTYTIFAETARHVINLSGRVGMIVPTGIATDSTTQYFFQDMILSSSLFSLYSFWEIRRFFLGTDSRIPFCLITITNGGSNRADFAFNLRAIEEVMDDDRVFSLSPEEIELINPNSLNCPSFESKYDAELAKHIYSIVPVLLVEDEIHEKNYWNIQFNVMFHMSNDSELFHTREDLERLGYKLHGNHFIGNETRYLPLYEAKLIHQFDHRYTTYQDATQSNINSGILPQIPSSAKAMPEISPLPRYWVNETELLTRDKFFEWYMGCREVTNSTSERTVIFSCIPRAGVGHKIPLTYVEPETSYLFLANVNSFVVDYCARQKIGGNSLSQFMLKQFPILPPNSYAKVLSDFVVPRVIELTYTAWDLEAFAQDVGWDGPPFVWDEERRFLMRCELDALYFHLYQIERDDVDYIMETFPIVKRKDEAAHGEYLTKRIILEMYDEMAQLPTISVPHPKGPHGALTLNPSPAGEGLEDDLPSPGGRRAWDEGDYQVPDVSQFETWLNPPPADPSVAHEDRRPSP